MPACKVCGHWFVKIKPQEELCDKCESALYRLSGYVAPVVHGKWVTTSEEVFPGSSQFLCYSHKHEECGFQYVGLNGNEYDYCPKCGAKMDLGNYEEMQ